MDDFVDRSAIADRRSGWRCCWSCSASRPSGSAPPSTTRRRATASGRASAAGWPGTRLGRRRSRSRILFIHPAPADRAVPRLGDRLGAVVGGLAYGLLGVGSAVGVRDAPLPPDPLPGRAGRTRARCSTRSRPRSSTRSTFRGALFGLLLVDRHEPDARERHPGARLRARRPGSGRPGRDRYLLVLTLGMGLIGGWLTAATGGIAAAFLGHAITRFAVFLCTGHTGQTKPRGREVEEIESAAGRPRAGGSSARGSGDAATVTGLAARPPTRRRRAAGRALRPRPVLRLALPVLRLRRRTPGAAARGPRNRIAAFVAALAAELDLRADALDARVRRPGRGAAAARDGLPRRRDAVAAAGRRRSPGSLDLVRARFGLAAGAEVTLEANPGPGRARRPGGLRGRRRHPAVDRRPEPRSPRSSTRLGRRHRAADVADAVAAARAAGIGSVSLDLLYDVPDSSLATWIDDARRARSTSSPTTSRSTR